MPPLSPANNLILAAAVATLTRLVSQTEHDGDRSAIIS